MVGLLDGWLGVRREGRRVGGEGEHGPDQATELSSIFFATARNSTRLWFLFDQRLRRAQRLGPAASREGGGGATGQRRRGNIGKERVGSGKRSGGNEKVGTQGEHRQPPLGSRGRARELGGVWRAAVVPRSGRTSPEPGSAAKN